LAAIHEGRGDGALYGLSADRTLFVKSDVTDEEKLRQGVQKTLRSLDLPAIKAPLAQVLGAFSLHSSERAVGDLRAQRFVLRPRGAPPTLQALFASRAGQAAFVVGAGAEPAMQRLLAAPGPDVLGADSSVHALSAELGKDVAFALFADAARLGFAEPQAGDAPALLVLNRAGRSAELTLWCSARALAALAVHLGGMGRVGQ
jgi:hypothetical protein